MLSASAWQVLLLAPAACAAGSAVLHLTEDNFDDALRRHPVILVQFYAPWCGHCRNLKPEYKKAAEALSGRVPLAAVDATKDVRLAEIYKVEGYPTMLFFRRGQPEEYLGGVDSEGIVSWVTERTAPSLTIVVSEEALEKELAKRQTVSYFVARGGEALKAAMGQVAEEQRNKGVFVFLERKGTPVSVEVHRGLKEVVRMEPLPARSAADGAHDVAHIRRFVLEEMVPPFGEVDEHNFEGYLMRATRGMIWVCFGPSTVRDDVVHHADTFQSLAARFPQFPVAYTDTKIYQDHVREELGCNNFPTVVLQLGNFTDETSNPRRFKLDLSTSQNIEPAHIGDWIRQALAGEVEEDEGLDELDAIDDEDIALASEGDAADEDEFAETAAEQARAAKQDL